MTRSTAQPRTNPHDAGRQGYVKAAQRTYRAAKRVKSKSGSTTRPQNILKGTWLAGILIMWIYPLSTPEWKQRYNGWVMRQMLWTCVHIVLLLLCSIGPRMARASAAFGGLSLLALLLAPAEDGLAFGRMISRTVRDRASQQPSEQRTEFNVSAWLDYLQTPAPAPDPNAPPVPLPPRRQVPDDQIPLPGFDDV